MRIILNNCSQNGSESPKQVKQSKSTPGYGFMITKEEDSILKGVPIKRLQTPSYIDLALKAQKIIYTCVLEPKMI